MNPALREEALKGGVIIRLDRMISCRRGPRGKPEDDSVGGCALWPIAVGRGSPRLRALPRNCRRRVGANPPSQARHDAPRRGPHRGPS